MLLNLPHCLRVPLSGKLFPNVRVNLKDLVSYINSVAICKYESFTSIPAVK